MYRSYYTDNIADANHRFTVDLTAHTRMTRRGDILEGMVMCAPVTSEELEADVVRLLEQARWGRPRRWSRKLQPRASGHGSTRSWR